MAAHTIKLLYYLAAACESAGVLFVIDELVRGKRRARRFVKRQPYSGPRFGGAAEKLMPNRMRQQRERQARGVVHDQARLTREVLTILSARFVGPVLLIVGIVVGTIANVANTH